jgi:hypothetical protein
MRILNFDEFLLCYSTKKEPPRCSLHRWVQIISVAYTEDSTKKFFSQKLTGVGYTGESRLPGVAYTGESRVQPSRSASALKGTIPLKRRLWVSVKYWLLGIDSCIENFSDLTPSDWLPGVAYTGVWGTLFSATTVFLPLTEHNRSYPGV